MPLGSISSLLFRYVPFCPYFPPHRFLPGNIPLDVNQPTISMYNQKRKKKKVLKKKSNTDLMEEKQAAQNRMIHVLASRHPRPKLGQEEFCHQTRLGGEKAHPRRKPQERHPPRHPHSVPSAMGPARSDLVSCTKMWLVECSALPLQAGKWPLLFISI